MVEEYRQAYENAEHYNEKKKILISLIGRLPENEAIRYARVVNDLQKKIDVLGNLDYDRRDQAIRYINQELDSNFEAAINLLGLAKAK